MDAVKSLNFLLDPPKPVRAPHAPPVHSRPAGDAK
jgi:hypothetical protein